MVDDGLLGKTLKCFDIYFVNSKMFIDITKDNINHTEEIDPSINTNTLALRICNKYDIPFILIKNEIKNKKREYKSLNLMNNIKNNQHQKILDYKIYNNKENLFNNISAFHSFNYNIKINKDAQMESIQYTKITSFNKTSNIDRLRTANSNKESLIKSDALKFDDSKNQLFSYKTPPKKIKSKTNSTSNNPKIHQDKIIKVNLFENKGSDINSEKKKLVKNSSERDFLVNRIYNARIKQKEDKHNFTSKQSFSVSPTNKYNKNLLNNDRIKISKKETSSNLKKSPEIELMKRNNSSNNIKEYKIIIKPFIRNNSANNKIIGKFINQGNIRKNDIMNKIINEVFLALDKDCDNKISFDDLNEENLSTTILKIFLPLMEKLINKENLITKEIFFFLCKEINENLSRINKISLIDWYMERKSVSKNKLNKIVKVK